MASRSSSEPRLHFGTTCRPSSRRACAAPLLELAERVQKDLGVAFDFSTPLGLDGRGHRILGAYYFAPKLAIFIDLSLLADYGARPRFRFTLAHELGHLSLHRKLTLDFESLDATAAAILDGRKDLRLGRRTLTTSRDWLEWQANYFAGSLLMPRSTLVPELKRQQTALEIRRPGRIYVDDQRDNKHAYKNVVDLLCATYQTSRTSTRIRLEQLGLVEDRRTTVDLPRVGGPVAMTSILADLVSKWLSDAEET